MAVSATVLANEVSHSLGYGYATLNLPTGTISLITNIADRAAKDFLLPPPMPGEKVGHIWSWLRSNSTVYLNDPYTASHANSRLNSSSGPVVTNGIIYFNFDGGAVPAWAFDSDTDHKTTVVKVSGLGIADGWHIPTTLSAAAITLAAANADLDVAATNSGVAFTFYQVFHASGTNFSGFDGYMTHDLNTSKPHLEVIPWSTMMNMYSSKTISPGRPQYVSYDESLTKFMFFPPPDADYVLRYDYMKDLAVDVIPDRFEGIVINSALAIAEGYADTPNSGHFTRLYAQQVQSAVAQDRTISRIEYFGYNGDSSDSQTPFPKYRDPDNNVTFKNTLY